jgi:hypothetical protein
MTTPYTRADYKKFVHAQTMNRMRRIEDIIEDLDDTGGFNSEVTNGLRYPFEGPWDRLRRAAFIDDHRQTKAEEQRRRARIGNYAHQPTVRETTTVTPMSPGMASVFSTYAGDTYDLHHHAMLTPRSDHENFIETWTEDDGEFASRTQEVPTKMVHRVICTYIDDSGYVQPIDDIGDEYLGIMPVEEFRARHGSEADR